MILLAAQQICTRNVAKVKPGAFRNRIRMETGMAFA